MHLGQRMSGQQMSGLPKVNASKLAAVERLCLVVNSSQRRWNSTPFLVFSCLALTQEEEPGMTSLTGMGLYRGQQ